MCHETLLRSRVAFCITTCASALALQAALDDDLQSHAYMGHVPVPAARSASRATGATSRGASQAHTSAGRASPTDGAGTSGTCQPAASSGSRQPAKAASGARAAARQENEDRGNVGGARGSAASRQQPVRRSRTQKVMLDAPELPPSPPSSDTGSDTEGRAASPIECASSHEAGPDAECLLTPSLERGAAGDADLQKRTDEVMSCMVDMHFEEREREERAGSPGRVLRELRPSR